MEEKNWVAPMDVMLQFINCVLALYMTVMLIAEMSTVLALNVLAPVGGRAY